MILSPKKFCLIRQIENNDELKEKAISLLIQHVYKMYRRNNDRKCSSELTTESEVG